MNEKRTHTFIPALLFWTALWWLAAVLFGNALLLPAPHRVFLCLLRLAATKVFWQTLALSIARILLGITSATALGILLAVITTRCRFADALIAPALTAMQAVPVASFAILVLIWLERDWVPVLICAMIVLPVIWSGVSAGIRAADPRLLEMAAVYRLPRSRRVLRIYLPSVMPFFRAACISALSLGWKAGIAAEVLTLPRVSIGRMLSEAKLYLLTEELFAWTLAIIALSLLLQRITFHLLKRGDRDA